MKAILCLTLALTFGTQTIAEKIHEDTPPQAQLAQPTRPQAPPSIAASGRGIRLIVSRFVIADLIRRAIKLKKQNETALKTERAIAQAIEAAKKKYPKLADRFPEALRDLSGITSAIHAAVDALETAERTHLLGQLEQGDNVFTSGVGKVTIPVKGPWKTVIERLVIGLDQKTPLLQVRVGTSDVAVVTQNELDKFEKDARRVERPELGLQTLLPIALPLPEQEGQQKLFLVMRK